MSEEHKGLPVHGYQVQSKSNVDLVNTNKIHEEKILRIIDELGAMDNVDKRWLAIAKTDLEKGFMALNRSIFKPSRLQGDLNVQEAT